MQQTTKETLTCEFLYAKNKLKCNIISNTIRNTRPEGMLNQNKREITEFENIKKLKKDKKESNFLISD